MCPPSSSCLNSASCSSSTERLKKINSQEELDFHELSSGSDQSELFGDDNFRERLLDNARQSTPGLRRTFGRLVIYLHDLNPHREAEGIFSSSFFLYFRQCIL